MISIVLLFKIIGIIGLIVSWIWMLRTVRRTARRFEYLKEQYDARITAVERSSPAEEAGVPDAALAETRRRAIESERRFTEGIASILNFSHTSTNVSAADTLDSGNSKTGRKGD